MPSSKTTFHRLSPTLEKQVDSFIDSLRAFNKKRPRPRLEKDYEYLRCFFKRFLQDQNDRALEIESRDYQKVLAYALKQFPVKTMLNLCIDGRVLPILIYGASAIISSSVRVPGGMLRDFIRGTDGRLKLRKNSYYAGLLDAAFARYNLDVLSEIYDSHLGCAARLAEEQSKGRNPDDLGVYADVSHKKQIADAVIRYCQETYGDRKKVIPIQTSFDPHTGFLYMGLETQDAMLFAKKTTKGFTKDVLDELVERKKIISTEKLVAYSEIKKTFDHHIFTLDWKNQYVKSADKFWHAIASMRDQLFPVIKPLLLNVYPHLSKNDKASKPEREERLFLLLANAFSGYLLNYAAQPVGKITLEHQHVSHYPFTTHQEEGVHVSEGVYPPNKISMFAVFNLDEKNLVSSIDLSVLLVRKNRAEGRVTDVDNIFSDTREFVESSVPIIVQEVVREILGDEWKKLDSLDWGDLPENWDEMSDIDFIEYLHKKQNMPAGVVIAINNLRHRMAVLYNPESPTSSHLVEHYKVALPVIAGRFRKNHFIVPFVKLGFNGSR